MNDLPIKLQITLSDITKMLDENSLSKARTILAPGTKIKIDGEVLKVIKRNENPKVLIKTKSFNVFAEFEKGFCGSFRKGQTINLTGYLQTFGSESVCLNQCSIN